MSDDGTLAAELGRLLGRRPAPARPPRANVMPPAAGFAARLRTVLASGVRTSTIATAAGVSPATVTRWARGTSTPADQRRALVEGLYRSQVQEPRYTAAQAAVRTASSRWDRRAGAVIGSPALVIVSDDARYRTVRLRPFSWGPLIGAWLARGPGAAAGILNAEAERQFGSDVTFNEVTEVDQR